MAHRVRGSSYRDHFLVDLYLVCTLDVRVLKRHHLEHAHYKQVDVHQLVVLLVPSGAINSDVPVHPTQHIIAQLLQVMIGQHNFWLVC
jgi:hypothetical protein